MVSCGSHPKAAAEGAGIEALESQAVTPPVLHVWLDLAFGGPLDCVFAAQTTSLRWEVFRQNWLGLPKPLDRYATVLKLDYSTRNILLKT